MARRRKPSEMNLLIAVDKPLHLTSHDVVARVRRQLDERRVGHAGTLDPLASGVMVVGVGQATRLLGQLALDRKRYVAGIAFGAETATDDAEGAVTRVGATPPQLMDEGFARSVLAGFVGPQEQVPPAYSAISVGGVRSYRRARAGEEVALEPRAIEVFSAELLHVEAEDLGFGDEVPLWTVVFDVSKGTYIRSLARDIGRAAGSAAHLAALTRTRSGSVGLLNCLQLDAVTPETARAGALDPVAALGLPAVELSEAALGGVLCGRPLPLRDAPPRSGEALGEGDRAALVRGGALWAIASAEGGRLCMKTVFPQGIGGVI